MALKVWFPLNGDLTNNGVLNNTITNANATVDNTGKIGKCYVCASGNHISFTNPITTSTTDFAISCWIYVTEYTNGYSSVFSSRTATSGKGIALWMTPGSIRFDDGEMWTVSNTFTLNTWTHICVTYSKTSGKSIYVNGNLIGSKATVGTLANLRSELFIGYDHYGYYLGGKVNDLRVWEGSAPSPKEVELLARGLVLHYPLSGGRGGQNNLLKNTGDLTKWNKENGITVSWDNDKNMYKIEDSSHTSSRWGIYQDFSVQPNTTYTVSCTLLGDYSGCGFGVFDTSAAWPGETIIYKNSTTKSRLTYTLTSGANSSIARVYISTHCGTSKVAWCTTPKVEIGSKSTPWITNSTDTEYNAMGYNNNTEYDVSGYLHNGTINGSVSYSSDTARYSVSTEFSKAGYVNVSSFNVDTSAFTLNFWVKMKTATSQHFVLGTFNNWTGNGIGVYRDANTVNYLCLIRSAGESTYKSFALGLSTGSWYMLTLTYDGTNYKGYLNGVLKQNVTYGSSGVVSNPVFMVGNSKFNSTPASENEEAFVSDVRFYATALTAEDIQKLYNTSTSISNT